MILKSTFTVSAIVWMLFFDSKHELPFASLWPSQLSYALMIVKYRFSVVSYTSRLLHVFVFLLIWNAILSVCDTSTDLSFMFTSRSTLVSSRASYGQEFFIFFKFHIKHESGIWQCWSLILQLKRLIQGFPRWCVWTLSRMIGVRLLLVHSSYTFYPRLGSLFLHVFPEHSIASIPDSL